MSVALFKNGSALDAEITDVESGLSGHVLFLLFFIYFYFIKLDTYHIKKVLGYISEGLPKEKACTIAGISKSAFYLWYNQGKEERVSRVCSVSCMKGCRWLKLSVSCGICASSRRQRRSIGRQAAGILSGDAVMGSTPRHRVMRRVPMC